MNRRGFYSALIFLAAVLIFGTPPAKADITIQCPTRPGGSFSDDNGDGVIRADDGEIRRPVSPREVCMHLSAGDGFVTMADDERKLQYIFSFHNVTDVPADQVMMAGMLAAEFPASTMYFKEGDEVYLDLSNVGMMMRPDLFDPHTVHWHGFPQAASVFDGVPDASIAINMGFTFTYYYKVMEPGTYMYHCHVEATEHMQMGMLGNLYVTPAQDDLPNGTIFPNGFIHSTGNTYAYNDGDGSTIYDVDYPIQIAGFDSYFHDQHLAVQPLPFALMRDDYALLNGRGYPDTVNPGALPAPAENGYKVSQKVSSLITAAAGQRILLRLSSLDVQRFYTLTSLGLNMEVVGYNARIYRGPDGKNLYYKTNTVTLGGGEAIDVILEIPATATPGTTYFLYTSNLNYLSNGPEDFGGMMTEIRVN